MYYSLVYTAIKSVFLVADFSYSKLFLIVRGHQRKSGHYI